MTSARGAIAVVLVLLACRDVTTNVVSDRDAGGSNGGAGAAGNMADAGQPDAGPPRLPEDCGGHVCACDDGLDTDSDGLVDGFDPECTAPFDDDEHSFATGSPTGGDRCRDCFWDDNAGSGDDGCRYPAECLAGEMPTGAGNCGSCEVGQGCVDTCLARTPNGCDCFGCCEVARDDGSALHIALNDACSLAKLDDTLACPRCVPSSACANPCARCELCPGKRASDLPADCGGAPGEAPQHVCDDRLPVCSETTACFGAAYCQFGCCVPTVF